MELVVFSLLLSIGIPPVWGVYRSIECINDSPVIRCEDGLGISIQKGKSGRFTPGNIYCGERKLPDSRSPDITPCLLEYFQNKCNDKSYCKLSADQEHSCSTGERRTIFLSYSCISRCGSSYTCNETTEVCWDSKDGATCKCAKNYHKNVNNICTPDLFIRCESGVINISEGRKRDRPTLNVFRDQNVISYPAPCSSTDELNNTKTRCNNQQYCAIPDRTTNVPCVSYMVYDCVPKCGFNDGCNLTTQVCTEAENGIKCECAEKYQKNSEGFCTTMDTPHTTIAQCAHESIFIHCYSGVINVERARRDERPTFTVNCGGEIITNYSAPCLSSKELANMKTGCNNQSSCNISDKNREDNLCHSYMNFTCATYTAHSEVSQCVKKRIGIHCDIGVIHIEPAQNDERPTFTVNCGERVITNYSVPFLSQDEFAKVKAKCANKSSCKISNKMDEDIPCHSYMDYKCISRCGVTDDCNKTSEVCSESDSGTECHCAQGYDRNREAVCTEIILKCPGDVQHVNGQSLTFNETQSGQVAYSRELCPPTSSYPNRSLASRNCTDRWEELKTTKCYTEDTLNIQLEAISQMDVTNDNVEEVAEILALASEQAEDITDNGLDSLITSLDSVVEVGNPEVTDSVVGVVSNVMAINDSTLDDTKNVNSIVSLLEIQVASVLEAGQNYSELTENLEVNAVQIERASLKNNYTFHSHLKGVTSDNDEVEDDYKKSSILLPASVLHLINEGVGIVPISLIAYQDASLFQPNDVTSSKDSRSTLLVAEYIDSHVISATVELDDVIVKGLPSDSTVLTSFSYPVIPPNLNETNITVELVCVYWDKKDVKWSKLGCRMLPSEEDDEIVCSCDHLTSFAILVRAHDNTPFYRALTITSKVGCIICIFSLSFCVIALLTTRPVRKKQQTHVHLNLCLALLGFYLSFLLGIDKAQNPRLCEAMTSLIYFFCLSSMAWMSVEAFYIYTLIWKYNRSGIRHFIPVAACFAWGLPAFGSVLVYILEESHDYVNEPDYCFLHPGNVLEFGFVLEMGILFLYNITVFSLATYRVGCRRMYFSKKDEKRVEVMTRVKSTFLFWILLGMSWIFAFLSILPNSPNPVFEVLFCICFSLQGFCMLYMLILQNPEMMKSLKAKRKPAFTSVTMPSGMKNVYVVRKNSGKGNTLGMQSNPLSSTTDYF